MTDVFGPMRAIKRRAKDALKSVSPKAKSRKPKPQLEHRFAPIVTVAAISPVNPLSHGQPLKKPRIQLKVIPPRVSSLRFKAATPRLSMPEEPQNARPDHLKSLLSGLDSDQEAELFAALLRFKTELLQGREDLKDAPQHSIPRPRRKSRTFAQTYAAASFSDHSPATTVSTLGLPSPMSPLPDFDIPTSKAPTFASPAAPPSFHSSRRWRSPSPAPLFVSPVAASSVYSSQRWSTPSESPSVISEAPESPRIQYCSCTEVWRRHSDGHLMETHQTCEDCIRPYLQRRSLRVSAFRLGSPPTPKFITWRNRPCFVETFEASPVDFRCDIARSDFDHVYDTLDDINSVRIATDCFHPEKETPEVGHRLEDLFDMVCCRATDTRFVIVPLADGIEASQLYSNMLEIHGQLLDHPEDPLRAGAEQLIRDMHAKISALLQL